MSGLTRALFQQSRSSSRCEKGIAFEGDTAIGSSEYLHHPLQSCSLVSKSHSLFRGKFGALDFKLGVL